jgi:hypothetical protein
MKVEICGKPAASFPEPCVSNLATLSSKHRARQAGETRHEKSTRTMPTGNEFAHLTPRTLCNGEFWLSLNLNAEEMSDSQ